MTDKDKTVSLDERLAHWLQIPDYIEACEGAPLTVSALIGDLIADRERLIILIDDLQRAGRNMAQITDVNAQWYPMLQKAEKEIERLLQERRDLVAWLKSREDDSGDDDSAVAAFYEVRKRLEDKGEA